MDKSYNDIMQQAARIVERNKSRKLFTDCHGNASEQDIWKLAAVTLAQHGISRFCKDRDKKYKCVKPYTLKIAIYVPWWETPHAKEVAERVRKMDAEIMAKYAARKPHKDPTDGMTYAQRVSWCVQRMQASVVDDMQFRIRDMLVRSLQFGSASQEYGCNPLQLTQAVYADAKKILDTYNTQHKTNNAYQLKLF